MNPTTKIVSFVSIPEEISGSLTKGGLLNLDAKEFRLIQKRLLVCPSFYLDISELLKYP